jgi:serine/threonine protein kinase
VGNELHLDGIYQTESDVYKVRLGESPLILKTAKSARTKKSALKVWWDNKRVYNHNAKCGAFVMKWGVPYDSSKHGPLVYNAMFQGVSKVLRIMHEGKHALVHRDIRKSNMLFIDNEWLLIDYGLSGKANEITVIEAGGRLDRGGLKLRETYKQKVSFKLFIFLLFL